MKKQHEERYYCVVRKNGEIIFQNLDGSLIAPQKAKHLAEGALSTLNEVVYVYLAKDPDSELYKIGMSKTPNKRAAKLGVQLIHVIPCTRFGPYSARKVEKLTHEFFRTIFRHIEGEWFELHGFDVMLFRAYSKGENCINSMGYMLDEIKNYISPIQFPSPEQFNDLLRMMYHSSIDYGVIGVCSILVWARRVEAAGNSSLALHLMQHGVKAFYEQWFPEKGVPKIMKVDIPTPNLTPLLTKSAVEIG